MQTHLRGDTQTLKSSPHARENSREEKEREKERKEFSRELLA